MDGDPNSEPWRVVVVSSPAARAVVKPWATAAALAAGFAPRLGGRRPPCPRSRHSVVAHPASPPRSHPGVLHLLPRPQRLAAHLPRLRSRHDPRPDDRTRSEPSGPTGPGAAGGRWSRPRSSPSAGAPLMAPDAVPRPRSRPGSGTSRRPGRRSSWTSDCARSGLGEDYPGAGRRRGHRPRTPGTCTVFAVAGAGAGSCESLTVW